MRIRAVRVKALGGMHSPGSNGHGTGHLRPAQSSPAMTRKMTRRTLPGTLVFQDSSARDRASRPPHTAPKMCLPHGNASFSVSLQPPLRLLILGIPQRPKR
jgi:hypothetical protein